MNTGCWISKKVITSHVDWKWQERSKKIKYMMLGAWTAEDSEAYERDCAREKKEIKMAPGYARGGVVLCGSNRRK